MEALYTRIPVSGTFMCASVHVWQVASVSDCDHMDYDPPVSSVHGILQARILEWVAVPSFRGILPIWGSNPHLLCLLHWQAVSLPLVPPGKPLKPSEFSPKWSQPHWFGVQTCPSLNSFLWLQSFLFILFVYPRGLSLLLAQHLICIRRLQICNRSDYS